MVKWKAAKATWQLRRAAVEKICLLTKTWER